MASTSLIKKAAKPAVSPAPAAPKKGLAAIVKKAKAAPAVAVKDATEGDTVVTLESINKMGNAEIDALVARENVPLPAEWGSFKVGQKKKWLSESLADGAEKAAEKPAKQTAAAKKAEAKATAAQSKKDVAATKAEVKAAAKKAKEDAKAAKAAAKAAKPPKVPKVDPTIPLKNSKFPVVTKTVTKVAPQTAAKQLGGGEVITGADHFSDIINLVENLTEAAAKGLVASLSEGTGFATFKLGGVLSRIQEQGWFTPFASFREYVEAEHSMKYRSAAYAVQVYNDLAKLNISYDRVKEVPWTKLREISGVLTHDNIEKWVAAAKKSTVVQLIETVKAHKNKNKQVTGETEAKMTKRISFLVHGDQDATINAAIAKAKEVGNTDVATSALEYICLEFMGSSKSSLKEQLQKAGLDKALEVFEAAFPDVTLTADMPQKEAA